jgi:1-deoxy-D-xylulose-5-phosphate synthase
LPVLFAIDRAGLVGPDGPTHAGSFDYSYLRCLPGMVIMAPANENECRQMLYTGFLHDGPAAVRYPRGKGPGVEVQKEMTALPLGKAEILREGKSIALLAFGSMVPTALEVGDKLDATVINMRFVKPLDEELILKLAKSHDLIVSVEENAIPGGAGNAINEVLNVHACRTPLLTIGLPDVFVEQGSREEVLTMAGLDTGGLLAQIEAFQNQLHSRKPGRKSH